MVDPETARMQAQAIESAAQDAPIAVPAKAQDAPSAPLPGNEAMGKTVQGQTWDKPYDEQWTHALRNKLLKSGMITEKDISEQALMDPAHRRWLNKLLKKWAKGQESAASESETGGTEQTPPEEQAPPPSGAPESQVPTTLPPAATNNNVPPRVLAGGRLPTGEIFQTTAGPWGTGWIPAGNGLYWPPWPSTGGPIAMPSPRRRQGEAEPMPRTLTADGQATGMERA